jgi:xanthine dehydrogenase/oxidase
MSMAQDEAAAHIAMAVEIMSELKETYLSEICFYINGKKVVEANVEPETTLLSYLRSPKINLTGAKLGCGEGGCGACTVMLSHYDDKTDKIIHRSVNACLFPLAALDGHHVITVEGIGSTTKGLHPIQERIAKFHGSQCGFCTPGIVMALYAFMRNNPKATKHDIEEAFDGNLCRCTGYRPILAAAKSLAVDSTSPCGMGEACCRNRKSADTKGPHVETNDDTKIATVTTDDLDQAEQWSPYDPKAENSELIFPPALKRHRPRSIVIVGKRCIFFQPASVTDMLQIKKHCADHNLPHRIVVGNTEIGIETTIGKRHYPILISTHAAARDETFTVRDNGFEFGTSKTLTELRKFCKQVVTERPEHEAYSAQAIIDQLRWFSSTQIRNVATPGGNIMTASPIADMNPVLQAAGAVATLYAGDKHREVPITEFFTGYRRTVATPEEVLCSVFVPFTRENEFMFAFKQARRREDDISIVTAGIRMLLEPSADNTTYTIKEAALSYGGMAAVTKIADKTCAYLVGKSFDEKTIEGAYAELYNDFPLPPQVPGGMPEYRNSLAASFLFKFYIQTSQALQKRTGNRLIPQEYESAGTPFERPVSYGRQVYQVPANRVDGMVGTAVTHLAAEHQVSGEAKYTDDYPDPFRCAHAAFVLSERALADIVSVDISKAKEVDGFVDYITHTDVTGSNGMGDIVEDEECFATKRVTCVGQVIGLVVAETEQAAELAAHMVKVEYADVKDATIIHSIDQAIEYKSFHGDAHVIVDGDIEKGFAECDRVIEGKLNIGAQEHFYLETNACIVTPKENGEFHIIASTQNPTKTQEFAAHAVGIPAAKVVCEVKRMGGGFGGKESRSLICSSAATVAAHKLQRPIRMFLKRAADMKSTGQRGAFAGTYKAGFNNDGTLVALEANLYTNAGNSMDLSVPIVDRGCFHIDNSYKWPNLKVTGRACKTNKPSNTAFRGFGGPQGMLIAENIIDQIAGTLGMTAHDLRAKNLYKSGDRTHFRQEMPQCNLRKMWAELEESSDLKQLRDDAAKFNAANKFRKRGVAMIPTKFGCAFTAQFMNQGGALVHVYTDGSVLVTHGGTEMGQGLFTKMAQIAATEFNIPLEKVLVSSTATDKVANTSPTAASLSSDINGAAVKHACDQINARLDPLREANPDAAWEKIVNMAYFDRINLSAQGFHKVPNVGYDFETGTGRAFSYFSYGIACSNVEIDILTGDFHILRTDILMDVGSSLNPTIDVGQVEGGFTQGLGLFTMEEIIWGDNDHQWIRNPGSLLTFGPGAYKIPSFNDVPIDFRVSLLKDTPNPIAIHSSKAVGEPPLFLASAVFFALKDAIQAARSDRGMSGFFQVHSPLTVERIRMACADQIADAYTKSRTTDAEQYQPLGSW